MSSPVPPISYAAAGLCKRAAHLGRVDAWSGNGDAPARLERTSVEPEPYAPLPSKRVIKTNAHKH